MIGAELETEKDVDEKTRDGERVVSELSKGFHLSSMYRVKQLQRLFRFNLSLTFQIHALHIFDKCRLIDVTYKHISHSNHHFRCQRNDTEKCLHIINTLSTRD